MDRPERAGWRLSALVGLAVLLIAFGAPAQDPSAPPRVRVTLVGVDAREAELGPRVRTLFDPEAVVEVRLRPSLSSVEVLEPARSDTVYVFVTLARGRRALVYVATREGESGAVRYLLREVELGSGLDEMGAETVAQVAHSSAMALFSRAAETSQDAVAGELARAQEGDPPRSRARAATSQRRDAPTPRSAPEPGAERRFIAPRVGVEVGARYSGAEGWLVSPGLLVGATLFERWGLSLHGSYLVPSRFEVPPVLVRLSGLGAEARASALLFRAGELGVRLDAGGGVLFVRWAAEEILSAEASPWRRASERESRGYLLAGLSLELPVGSLLEAALRGEVRLLTTPVRYGVEVDGLKRTRSEVRVAPGLALELSLPPSRSRPSAQR
jgi:hypothetical protein